MAPCPTPLGRPSSDARELSHQLGQSRGRICGPCHSYLAAHHRSARVRNYRNSLRGTAQCAVVSAKQGSVPRPTTDFAKVNAWGWPPHQETNILPARNRRNKGWSCQACTISASHARCLACGGAISASHARDQCCRCGLGNSVFTGSRPSWRWRGSGHAAHTARAPNRKVWGQGHAGSGKPTYANSTAAYCRGV